MSGIEERQIEGILDESMGVYSYNINLFRAFPSAYDGLKPVARRIMYTMYLLKNYSDKPHRKCAKIVGDTMGSLHPHGDASIYEALVKMAQSFYMRMPLVDGHGNFGSISGDSASAMRYTEARSSKIGDLFLYDLDKNCVDFSPSFDNQINEPLSLPVPFPNLIIEGSYGIGQAYLSSIPSHNPIEVIDMTIDVIKKKLTLDDISKKLRPDYPTGGIIINNDELTEAYKKGIGKVVLRAKTEIKDNRITITEIPYMTSLDSIKEKIADAVKSGKITDISDLEDDTNKRNGVRLVIKVKRGVDPESVEKQLFKFTPLQSTMTFCLIATEGLSFKIYNIMELFETWINYRRTTLKRIFNFKIEKMRRRIHVIEGLLIALNDIDNVVKLIKKSANKKEAVDVLLKSYNKLTELQATSIVELQLYRLTKMNVGELEKELSDLRNSVNDLLTFFIPEKMDNYIISELEENKKLFKSERRTQLTNVAKLSELELVPDVNYMLFFTNQGFIKKMSSDNMENKRSYGKLKEEDYVIRTMVANAKDNLFCFTNKGRVFNIRVHELEETKPAAYGTNIAKYLELNSGETVVSYLSLTNEQYESENGQLIFVTEKGLIKRSSIKHYQKIQRTGIIALKLNENDDLVGVKFIGSDISPRILIATRDGEHNIFEAEDVTESLRISIGMKSMTLKDEDRVVSFNIVDEADYIGVVTANGYGKKVDSSELKVMSRGKKGKIFIKLNEGDKLVKTFIMSEDSSVAVITNKRIAELDSSIFKTLIRSSSGKIVVKNKKDEHVLDAVVLE